ncbi:MAG: SDR family NAD(P)-dependent oxidoreductase [Saprospirales bacterium]|nr:SDR family NAD(P)-dependent oxidoreductase [Saprospirales bacterium]
MDTSKQFLIAFHENNRSKAHSLQEALTPAGCSFELLSSADVAEPGEFSKKLLAGKGQVVLLVSDNLLKDEQCMYAGLETVQQLSSSNRLLSIVIDGEYPGQDPETVTTVFERVGYVIQYLNFWQDEYINLRQKRRHLEEADDQEKVNESLRVVRQVSSEIGEYLRHLRVVKHYTWEQVSANEWELFFRLNQFQEGHSKMKMATLPEEIIPTVAPDAEVEVEVEVESEDHEETPPVIEWDEMPGIASLGGPPSETPSIEDESADSDGQDAPEPIEHQATEIEKVESLFEEAVPEEVEEEEEEDLDQDDDDQDDDQDDDSDEEEVAEGISNVEEPEEAGAILEDAKSQFEKGDLVTGLNLLSQAVEDHPQSALLRYHYAQALLQYAHNPREAALELEKLVRFAPGHVQAWFLLGELAEMARLYRQARQYFEHAVYLEPDFSKGLFRLGLLLNTHFEGEEKKAAKYFRKAFKADKEFADAHYQYGVLQYERLGNPQKGVKSLHKALRYQPEHPFAHYDLALIYHSLGELEKAHLAYQNAVTNNPELQTPENDQAFFFEAPAIADQEAPSEPSPVKEPKQKKKKEAPSDSQGIVLITGATSGIGRATATAFAQGGYDLILTGRREEKLEDLQEHLQEKFGIKVRILCFDVRDPEEVAENLNELDGAWRQVDILINNAGLAKGLSPIHEGELAHWEAMIDTNLKGLLYVTRIVTPWMVERQKGMVINIGSIAGKDAYSKGNVYCATKFAVDGLTKAMRLDLHQHGIRVSQICPGHVEETEFSLVRFDGDAERAKIYKDFQPLNAADVADIILYMARAPKHVNIQDVVVTSTQQASVHQIDKSGRKD